MFPPKRKIRCKCLTYNGFGCYFVIPLGFEPRTPTLKV